MEVKILGTSCSKCNRLESKVRALVEDNNINASGILGYSKISLDRVAKFHGARIGHVHHR